MVPSERIEEKEIFNKFRLYKALTRMNSQHLGKGVYGVLYYAGHAYEDGGENFLLPVDANLKYNRQDSLRAQEILETMQECDTALNLLIIDSCRIR